VNSATASNQALKLRKILADIDQAVMIKVAASQVKYPTPTPTFPKFPTPTP